jgi:thioredoxin reductase
MTVATEITVVGAGPYGLSIAAHLRKREAHFRIIGSPMQSWLTKMPKGMLLKSDGLSSMLYDPDRSLTLSHYCKQQGIAYADLGVQVRVEDFSAYGMAFQQRLVPQVEDTQLVALKRRSNGFELALADGSAFVTRKVVLATGLDAYRHVPDQLANLPRELVTHSADHHDLARFEGRDVAVIGGGASAIDIATLLHEGGANARLIARKAALSFLPMAMPARSVLQHLRAPMSGVGAGWKGLVWSDAPWIYRYLFDRFRIRTAKKFLGPSGGWFMQQRVAAVPQLLGFELLRAEAHGARVTLHLSDLDGNRRQVSADHVIAATGYEPDVRRLPFLDPDTVAQIALIGQAPRLSAHFESSVPGLYFVGAISATSFGPSMRFVAGAEFASQRIVAHLTRATARGIDN